jgi:hypothetical protein
VLGSTSKLDCALVYIHATCFNWVKIWSGVVQAFKVPRKHCDDIICLIAIQFHAYLDVIVCVNCNKIQNSLANFQTITKTHASSLK